MAWTTPSGRTYTTRPGISRHPLSPTGVEGGGEAPMTAKDDHDFSGNGERPPPQLAARSPSPQTSQGAACL
jgi:hypothetical protein